MNRRELLKFFAVGTVITPLMAEAPLVKLIEEPKVELFTPDVVRKSLDLKTLKEVTVVFEHWGGERSQLTFSPYDIEVRHTVSPGDFLKTEMRFSYANDSPLTFRPAGSLRGTGLLL